MAAVYRVARDQAPPSSRAARKTERLRPGGIGASPSLRRPSRCSQGIGPFLPAWLERHGPGDHRSSTDANTRANVPGDISHTARCPVTAQSSLFLFRRARASPIRHAAPPNTPAGGFTGCPVKGLPQDRSGPCEGSPHEVAHAVTKTARNHPPRPCAHAAHHALSAAQRGQRHGPSCSLAGHHARPAVRRLAAVPTCGVAFAPPVPFVDEARLAGLTRLGAQSTAETPR